MKRGWAGQAWGWDFGETSPRLFPAGPGYGSGGRQGWGGVLVWTQGDVRGMWNQKAWTPDFTAQYGAGRCLCAPSREVHAAGS